MEGNPPIGFIDNNKGAEMVRVLFAILFCLTLSGCSISGIVQDVFDGQPVAKKEPVTYTCIGATEYFVGFKPNIEQLQIWPFNVTVVDEGATWTASYPNGKLQSAQLHYGASPRVVGGVDTVGHRWYRADSPKLVFSHSQLDDLGNGEGMTFFHCK